MGLFDKNENDDNIRLFANNNIKAEKLESEGKIDEALLLYKQNIDLNADTPFSYDRLSSIYHYKHDFESERDVLKLAVERLSNNQQINDNYKKGFKKALDNVEKFLNTGKWKYDCLPSDLETVYPDIRKAKTLLKSEEKEKGIELLEIIMSNGSYNNTVYNTLYQTYKKDKKYDDAIRVCDKAIENLGFFSKDRLSKWKENKEKLVAKKEKEISK